MDARALLQRVRGPWLAGLLLPVAAVLLAWLLLGRGGSGAALSYRVTRGPFVVTQIEGGEVEASRGEQIVSPDISGQLKIVHLWPEGSRVDVGDLVVQFDPAEFERQLLEDEGQLQRAEADYEKVKAQQDQRLGDLTRQIEQQQAQLELARLNRQRQTYGSPIDQQRSQIELDKSERALNQARENLAAQEVVRSVELRKGAMEIARRQERYEKARRNYDRTRIYAARPGLVVYRKIWKEGGAGESKIMVGDNVWGGLALMEIPDLSSMQVRCLVGEVDLKLLQVGQRAQVRLDAYPGPVFHGEVAKLAPMATPQPGAPDIRVFEMLVSIAEEDERLRPGMSAEVEVELETIADALSVPASAVCRLDGRPVVYCQHGRAFVAVPVEVGALNRTRAVIAAGLKEGDVVALHEPPRSL